MCTKNIIISILFISLIIKIYPQSTIFGELKKLTLPVAEFKERSNLKVFGQYVSPAVSPVNPERFTGYHTGVDVEYDDISAEVPVYAVFDGDVIYSGYVSGYGGVCVLHISSGGMNYHVLYGHLRPASLPDVGDKILQGDKIGVLGKSYSVETDGERKHLHFSILYAGRINLKGYVQTKKELSRWIDPFLFYK
ncbi:MAG: hypothetical protein A2015_00580 [Spirochaetes bacterium GWF1_31_7]|nr:MAG: hypothetical protein A2Y30_03930 [Spirochaetes bacterium GWE1_32_154]OHD45168.1 MAG: hypothetical protein A2Y29_15965 [Spirochaetes bacterium GWE2_31_10]OHD51078.1 MAG: hypothetical protein A2015_00580 [Spirochaetes bacterium GWF1_31_7]OHD80597.1 MAG: hypothetical protein A2355_07690 [Spirochaetes bacterium RIFOXYB1_FULL_32_8]